MSLGDGAFSDGGPMDADKPFECGGCYGCCSNEIARLRAENQRLRDLGVQETSDRIGAEQQAEAAEERAERLAEALRSLLCCYRPGIIIIDEEHAEALASAHQEAVEDARAALADPEPAPTFNPADYRTDIYCPGCGQYLRRVADPGVCSGCGWRETAKEGAHDAE